MDIIRCAAIVSCALVLSAGADQEFFCDAVNGNDAWDGTRATYVSGVQGPKKTIGAAVNLADGTPTIITVLPGVYDEGEQVGEDGLSARVKITKRNLLIRSTEGKEKTFISGRHASTANGLGTDAVRCVYIAADRAPTFAKADEEATNTVFRGFTFCNGATRDSVGVDGKGGAVYCATPDAGGAAMLVDCTVSNCIAQSCGGIFRCNAYRTLFVNNATIGGTASCMSFGAMACCVLAFNKGSSVTYSMRTAVNCTIAFNENHAYYSGYGMNLYNCLVFGNENNGESTGGNGYITFQDSVSSGPTLLHATKGKAPDSITNAPLWQCVSPATGDWRLLADSPAIGKGKGKHLTDRFILPPGETWTDILGNPIDASGAVDCGAVQASAVTPVGGRLAFKTPFNSEARFQIADKPAYGWRGAYHYGTVWPTTCRVGFQAVSSATPLYKISWKDGTKEVARRPGYDGYLNIVPPASSEEEQTLQAMLAAKAYYVNRATGNDSWDGLSATNVVGTLIGPKRTIQGACDVNESYSVINIAPGVYDEGASEKQESGYFSSNRVYIGRSTCLFASEGPGTVVVKGAPDPATGGIGQGAIRCLWVNNSECFVQGINLVDGYTAATSDSASRGGASYMGNGNNCVLSDCVVSNCHAKQAACMFYGNAERVRFVDCESLNNDLFRYATLYACEVSGMKVTNGGNLFMNSSVYGSTVDISDGACGVSAAMSACYFFGNLFVSGASAPAFGNGGTGNVWTADPGCVDLAARDYRLHMASPALGQVPIAAYNAANTQFSDSPTARLRLLSDVAGRPLRFANGAFDAGANQTDPMAVYVLTLEGGTSEDVKLTGGDWGTNPVAAPADISISVKPGRRPFMGIEVNGEMLPNGAMAYQFHVEPDMATAPVVRLRYGTEWYVDGVNGSDANGGGSPAGALEHIYAATTNAAVGDVVYVAPGVYGEGEGAWFHATPVDDDKTSPIEIGSRVLVPEGVAVRSLEGPARTFIVGAAAEGDYGLGAGAVRCVKLCKAGAHDSVIAGFTLTRGHTADGAANRDDYIGGAVLGYGTAEDCIISNNAAGRCGAVHKTTAIRCVIVENTAKYRASVGRESGFEHCYIDHNRGPEQAIQYHNNFYNTTIGPDNCLLDGSAATAIVNLNSGGRMYNSVLNCLIGNYGSDEARYFNCVFNRDLCSVSGNRLDPSCILAAPEELVFEEGRPVIGGNICVDAADERADYRGANWNGLDLDGTSRVKNARMDVGAYEADWLARYSSDISRRVTVTAVTDDKVHETPARTVRIPDGEVVYALARGNRTGRLSFTQRFFVDGLGTLSLFRDGAKVADFTASPDEQTVELRLAPEETGAVFKWVYVPAADDVGAAELRALDPNAGFRVILR